jgi:hypothetical protein
LVEGTIMKRLSGVLVAVALLGVGLCFWQVVSGSPASAGDQLVPAVASVVLPALGDEPSYSYVGSKKCKMCHKVQYDSWMKTKKFTTFESLKPGNAVEVKEKHGLDPKKDYTTDESCLKCHTTGYGKEGGYAIPDAADEKAVKKAGKLAPVGCESCHGPGSAYVKEHKKIKKGAKEGLKYKVEDLYAMGMVKQEAAACTGCHNDKSPTYDASKAFNYDEMKGDGTHEHVSLSQRQD